MPGVCSFNSNSNRLILGTCKRDQRIYMFFKEHMASHDDYKYLWRNSQKVLNVKPWSDISRKGLFHKKELGL